MTGAILPYEVAQKLPMNLCPTEYKWVLRLHFNKKQNIKCMKTSDLNKNSGYTQILADAWTINQVLNWLDYTYNIIIGASSYRDKESDTVKWKAIINIPNKEITTSEEYNSENEAYTKSIKQVLELIKK